MKRTKEEERTLAARVLRAAELAIEAAGHECRGSAKEALAALTLAHVAAAHTVGMTEDEAVQQFRGAFKRTETER